MARKIWNEITIKEFIESETDYKFISVIKLNGMKSKVLVWCGNPNHKSYEVRFDAFKGTSKKEGTRCEQCRRDNDTIWTREKIIKYVESQNYKFIEFIKFNKYASIIKIQCNNGHKPYEVYFSNFYSGKRCNQCYIIWSKDNIIKFVENEKYEFINFITFEKYNSLIKIKCPKGHIVEIRFRKFKEGIRCSKCNESKGEKEIERILNKYNIIFKPQYKFKDCRCKNSLPFDFYIPSLNVLIEFDGIQHFEILPHWGGIDKLIETKIHDTIKTKYSENNNIKLIRIPYWELNNIEEILNEELVLN